MCSHGIFLRRHEFFETLDEVASRSLESIIRQRTVPTGKTLFHEGAAVDGLYIVLAGLTEALADLARRRTPCRRSGRATFDPAWTTI